MLRIDRLLDESKRSLALQAVLKRDADKWQEELRQRQEAVSLAQAKARQAGLDPQAQLEAARDARLAELDLRHLEARAETDFESRREQARATVLAELEPLIAQLARQHRIDVVLVASGQIAYVSPESDLTLQLLQLYDSQGTGGAAKP